jgi:hypothetical protein
MIMTKLEAKKRAAHAAAVLILEACETEIFEDNDDFSEQDLQMLLGALREIGIKLLRKSK